MSENFFKRGMRSLDGNRRNMQLILSAFIVMSMVTSIAQNHEAHASEWAWMSNGNMSNGRRKD
jgi:hypothetical protein